MARVRIASDVGGTFTDSLAYDEDQAVIRVCKVPTTPDNRAVGTVQGLKQALRMLGRTGAEVNYVGHGMTTATNAVIQRKGAKIAFISNDGFRDMLEIGRQNRPRLYDYRVSRTAPIARRADRYTVSGRLDYTGTELQPVDTEQIKTVAARIHAAVPKRSPSACYMPMPIPFMNRPSNRCSKPSCPVFLSVYPPILSGNSASMSVPVPLL